MSIPATITWTRPKLKKFMKAIKECEDQGWDKNRVFVFEGKEFVVSYAKYLAEYLDGILT
jgi:hypothetical protein